MKRVKSIIIAFLEREKIRRFLSSKYYVVSFIAAVYILFIDETSIVSHLQNRTHLKEIKIQNEYYRKQIKVDRQKLEEINADQKDLEKYAREHFFLSKSDEDVFIVIEK
jgi:cell division protein FtsB